MIAKAKKTKKIVSTLKKKSMKNIEKQAPAKQKAQKAVMKKAAVKKAIVKATVHPSKPASNKALAGLSPYQLKKGEGYMSTRMKAHFRQILLDWKNSLTQEMTETVNSIKETPTQFADLSDRATQEEQFNLELRERDRDLKLIKRIDDTIKRIDDNSYGYCEACGEEIGLRRLEARPTAVLCVDCKTLDEIREKQEGI